VQPQVTLDGTDDPTFATNVSGRIVGWNSGAERLLGHRAEDVLGRACQQVVCGRDIFGNRFCREDCNLQQMMRRGEPVHGLLLDVHPRLGEFIRTAYSITIVRGGEQADLKIIHRLEPSGGCLVKAPSDSSAPTGILVSGSRTPRATELTERELEVLRLLAAGRSTADVARFLCVSVTTIRTHVQNLLGKLGVHSRLQAVALARRNGLL
jgi:PAS domain S-box-containing protein